MPEAKDDLAVTLEFLHALWADPEYAVPQRFFVMLGNGHPGATALAAYRKACTDKDDHKAATQLASVRDVLMNHLAQAT